MDFSLVYNLENYFLLSEYNCMDFYANYYLLLNYPTIFYNIDYMFFFLNSYNDNMNYSFMYNFFLYNMSYYSEFNMVNMHSFYVWFSEYQFMNYHILAIFDFMGIICIDFNFVIFSFLKDILSFFFKNYNFEDLWLYYYMNINLTFLKMIYYNYNISHFFFLLLFYPILMYITYIPTKFIWNLRWLIIKIIMKMMNMLMEFFFFFWMMFLWVFKMESFYYNWFFKNMMIWFKSLNSYWYEYILECITMMFLPEPYLGIIDLSFFRWTYPIWMYSIKIMEKHNVWLNKISLLNIWCRIKIFHNKKMSLKEKKWWNYMMFWYYIFILRYYYYFVSFFLFNKIMRLMYFFFFFFLKFFFFKLLKFLMKFNFTSNILQVFFYYYINMLIYMRKIFKKIFYFYLLELYIYLKKNLISFFLMDLMYKLISFFNSNMKNLMNYFNLYEFPLGNSFSTLKKLSWFNSKYYNMELNHKYNIFKYIFLLFNFFFFYWYWLMNLNFFYFFFSKINLQKMRFFFFFLFSFKNKFFKKFIFICKKFIKGK